LSRIVPLEKFGVILIALLFSIAGLYSLKLLSFLMPLMAILAVRSQGGIKNISVYVNFPIIIIFFLLLWIGITTFWTSLPIPALKAFISLCFIFFFSLLLISSTVKATPDLIEKAYAILKLAGLFLMLLIIFQLCLDVFHIQLKKSENSVYMMKPTGSILGLMGFVSCAFLWIYGNKLLAILTAYLLLILIYLTACQTAFLGAIFSIGILILSYLFPFWITRIAMVGTYTFLSLSPVLAAYIIPLSKIDKIPYLNCIINESLFHRFLAWEHYSKRFFDQPLWGWGVESTRYITTKTELSPGYGNVLHPHRNSLQAYVELGLIGGLLFALFFASLFWLVEKHVKDRLSVAVCNATLIFGLTAAEMTTNLWRIYWLSIVALTVGLIILFLKAREAQLHALAGRSK
jgi:exopolysaccharide production protein ExoQ